MDGSRYSSEVCIGGLDSQWRWYGAHQTRATDGNEPANKTVPMPPVLSPRMAARLAAIHRKNESLARADEWDFRASTGWCLVLVSLWVLIAGWMAGVLKLEDEIGSVGCKVSHVGGNFLELRRGGECRGSWCQSLATDPQRKA